VSLVSVVLNSIRATKISNPLTGRLDAVRLGYNRDMFRALRFATAAALALAVAALPVVLDQCAESCEAHRGAMAGTPSCHHATPAGIRIKAVPTRCGHDHSGTAATSAPGSTLADRSLDNVVATVALPASVTPAMPFRRVLTHAPPGPSSPPPDRSLPLRI
jgi:hypothetical protein